jgi:hypothetical protein
VCSIFIGHVNKKYSPSNLVPIILLVHTTYEDGTECSETSAHKIQTAENHLKEKNTTFRTRRRFEIKNNNDNISAIRDQNSQVFKVLQYQEISKIFV